MGELGLGMFATDGQARKEDMVCHDVDPIKKIFTRNPQLQSSNLHLQVG